MDIFFHSDDFGVEVTQSQAIKACYTDGVLNSISLMTTSPNAAECYDLIRDDVNAGEIYPVVHLNFIEGPALSSKDEVPDLVDDRGFFKATFVKILAVCFRGRKIRERYKKQLKAEIKRQMSRFFEIVDNQDILWGVDGHQHLHMIPLIWQALEEVLKEEGYHPDRIRKSVDPVSPLLHTPSVWFRIRFINLIKWILLRTVSPRTDRVNAVCERVPIFFGMFFTCRMEEDVVRKLRSKYEKYARSKGRDLELMFHAGSLNVREKTLDPTKDEYWKMISSEFRIKEQQTLKAL